MKKIQIVPGVAVSELVLGTDNFGVDQAGKPEDLAFELMDRYFELGGNTLDTAHVYGDFIPPRRHVSEKTIGKWLRSKPSSFRRNVVISTKGAHPLPGTPITQSRLSPDDINTDMDESLECLGVDRVDIYWLHRDEISRPVGGIMETLAGLVEAKKTVCFGVSNWRGSRIKEANEYAEAHGLPKIAASQIEYSLPQVNVDVIDSTLVVMDRTEFAFYSETGMPVFAFTSQGKGYFDRLKKGNLDEKVSARYTNAINARNAKVMDALCGVNGLSPTQNSVAWLRSNPCFEVLPILGCGSVPHLEDSVGAAGHYVDFDLFEHCGS